MSNKIHARNTKILMNGYDSSSWVKSVSMDDETEALDATTFGSDGYKEFITGFTEGTLSVEGLIDTGVAGGDEQVAAMAQSNVIIATVLPNGTTAGSVALCASGINTTRTKSFGVADIATASVELKPNGGFGYGKVLLALGAKVADFAGADLDNTVATTGGLLAVMQVTATAGTTPSTDVIIEHSVDGVTWAELLSFDLVTSGRTAQAKTVSGTVNRHLRVSGDLDADTTSITLQVAVVRL